MTNILELQGLPATEYPGAVPTTCPSSKSIIIITFRP
jgi:hypothetical protein